ncbi:MAG TPA: signal peptidase I [Candidatus Hydrogenedentes bacterium]|nr:signal peptidase I [Candidatus Hydrogenedentota bacterium]
MRRSCLESWFPTKWCTMPIDRDEIEKLHAEAKRIRKNFRYIQKDLQRSPENIDLLRQRELLKKRYEQILTILSDAREAEGMLTADVADEPEVPQVDMSIFEPKPFEVPASVYVKPSTQTGSALGAWITVKNLRILVAVIVLLFLIPFYYLYFMREMRFYEVPTRSMEPTLQVGDRIVASTPQSYERGDVVVLTDPQNPGDYLVKRLVALGGDTVEVANGTLFINNQPITEPYIKEPINYSFGPTTVPYEEIFLLGDNRNESDDSHIWQEGRVLSDLRGRVSWIYSPSERGGGIVDYQIAFSDVKSPE